jgi:hypothetical protein
MPPKIDPTKVTQQQPVLSRPPGKKPIKPIPPPLPKVVSEKISDTTKKSDLSNYGTQQKDRIERFYGAGAAAVSTARDIRLASATTKANYAYARSYQDGLKALKAPGSTSNLFNVATNAEAAYRTSLAKSGFTPGDVRGTSVVKAADFMRSQAKVPGGFTTASPDVIRQRVAAGENPQYFVRVMEKSRLSGANSTLSNPKSPHVWMATPQELAGAKLDGFETMKRVGFSDQYINQLKASGKKPSDFVLVVSEARGAKNQQFPTWDNITNTAKNHPDFAGFKRQANNPAFWNKVQTLDYKTHYEQMKASGADARTYAKTLPKSEQGAFLARDMMNSKLGVNEFFTGDGRTARTDGQNKGYGVREFLVKNDPVASMQRNTFIELRETGKTNLTATSKLPTISNNPLRLGSEMKTGALGGAAMSAVTSLPQVFDQARNGDYLGAGKTLVTNAGTGATVGALSSAGERIIGRSIENRLASSATSSLFSGTTGSVARQTAGRIGGAGVIGGVVNGGFAAYDQIGAYKRGEVTGSQAIGTVVGESAVGVGAGMAGAAAGAAIGSIIPGAGTLVGGAIGFVVGVGAGYIADKALRYGGVDKMIAKGVTFAIDKGMALGNKAVQAGKQFVGQQIQQAKAIYNSASTAVKSARQFVGQQYNNAKRTVSNATRAAVNYVSNVKNQVTQKVNSAVTATKQFVGQKVQQAKAIYNSATSAVKSARQFVGQKVDQAKKVVSTATRAAVNYVSQAKKQVVQTVNRAVNTVRNTVSNTVNSAKSAVSNAANKVGNAISGGLKSVFGW